MSDYFLADDLSGALDAAAAFHRVGRRVTIALSIDAWPEAGADEIVGLTTETRNAAPEPAAATVATVLAIGQAHGARLVYKKIDSTLRGPVAAEIAALTAAMPEARVLFTPANPRVGRTVRDGRLLVQGVPVSETEFARDPVSPVRESSLRALLGSAATPQVEIADAMNEADLETAVARMAAQGGPWVAVGSGALARPVAAQLYSAAAKHASPPRSAIGGPILFVGGSAHRANREQAAELARIGDIDVHQVTIADPNRTVVAAATESLRTRGGATILLEERRTESDVALRAIVSVAAELIARAEVARVFVTGGETAFALCGRLGIASLQFEAEIEAGLSVSSAVTSRGPMRLAVKPGGFGDAHTWVRAWRALQAAA